MRKVAVIGAGAAGLTATKRLSEPNSGCECCTFEQSDNVGGTWVYTDKVGKDEYGIPVHSSMYQGLRYISIIFLSKVLCSIETIHT